MKNKKKHGSALIMTIVLTVLLAIVAVMFLTVARMDRASTSNIADNKTLDLAAKSIIEIINKELINDTPGVAIPTQEYYDYPDAENPWLASIEPYRRSTSDPNYRWRQISDVTGYLKARNFPAQDVNVKPIALRAVDADVVWEYPEFGVDLNGNFLDYETGSLADNGVSADADGDGIADSKWFEVNDVDWSMRSSKGQRIYAAVRVIDHGGMININTAHSFDANTADGTSQMQVNLEALLKGTDKIAEFHEARCGSEDTSDWDKYKEKVIWDYNSVPNGGYLPFDISDELELRYRYCIDSKFAARIEANMPATLRTRGTPNFGHLYWGGADWELADWQEQITEPNNTYANRRHMLTTVNYDRVIDPNGDKMVNINKADANALYNAIHKVIPDGNVAAQIAVNIIDYRAPDPNITVLEVDGKNYYGFERPCVYISELAYKQVTDSNISATYKSYAIELYKPYTDDIAPDSTWEIHIDNPVANVSINDWTISKHYYVITWENPLATLDVNTSDANTQDEGAIDGILAAGSKISLTRNVNGVSLVVDSVVLPSDWPPDSNGSHCLRRDITKHRCIMRLWNLTDSNLITLGTLNSYNSTDANMIQAHPKNGDFTNIGEIGMIFRKPAYYKFVGGDSNGVIGYKGANKTETAVRLNLADHNYQQIFKYLTVFDPCNYDYPASEKRIKGRININTAPAFVIAQLPWVAKRQGSYDEPNLAQAIVAYRDKMKEKGVSDPNYNYENRVGAAGFETIGQLCDVNDGAVNYGIDYYWRKDGPAAGDQLGYPDLDSPTGDGAADDFEERDLIFARISDLVTVRSDVFTAYILVRVGVDGPQKRYIAIFDRTGVNSSADRVKIIAFQSVPEAR